MDHQAKAEAAYQAVLEHFYLPEARLFRENLPAQSGDRTYAYLWPYIGVVAAANAMLCAPRANESHVWRLRSLLDGLEKYWAAPGYMAYVASEGGGQRFYDDNAWVGLELLQAYASLKDQPLLDRAQQVFDFVMSGWSDDLGGGLFWREGDRATKNTCSNGPAAVLGLKLHELTGDRHYLESAQRLLDWTNAHLRSPEGVYWDNLTLDGRVDGRTFTYNTGIMIQADLGLFRATGERQWLDDALALGRASLAKFAPDSGSSRSFPATPWFNAVLFRAYLGLRDIAGEDAFATALLGSLEYGWEHARDGRDLVKPDWSGRGRSERPFLRLLDQAPVAEIYALAAGLAGGVSDDRGSAGTADAEPLASRNGGRAEAVAMDIGPRVAMLSPLGTTGYAQRFATHGRYFSGRHGDFTLSGPLYTHFERMGGPAGPLGFPVSLSGQAATSPVGTRGMCVRFEGSLEYPARLWARVGDGYSSAAIFWAEGGEPHTTWYEIGACYESFGGPAGLLGYPTGERLPATPSPQGTAGYCQRFEGGVIYWSVEHGCHPVIGEIATCYDSLGAGAGRLGFPTADANSAASAASAAGGMSSEKTAGAAGTRQRFEGGWIYVRPGEAPAASYDLPT